MKAQNLRWTLASASPRRLAILRQVGIEPRVLPAIVEEIENGHSPKELAVVNARRKAETVAPEVGEGVLLAADTIVVVDGDILGKPRNAGEASTMLRRLSGCAHQVITGYSLSYPSQGLSEASCEITTVRMRTLREWEIDDYIMSGEPFDKAGGYGIQGRAAPFVEKIEGCFFNVVGLPIARILDRVASW